MEYRLRLYLSNAPCNQKEGGGFGRGIDLLLRGVDRLGSLNRAAKELGMAYSKAWRIVGEAEAEFNIQLIQRDGARGSTLTDEGRVFLTRYEEMLRAADKAAARVFRKYYGEESSKK